MQERGLVVEVVDDVAKIKFMRTSACGNCKACGLRNGKEFVIVSAKNQLNAKVDDAVLVEIDTKLSMLASALAYLIPLFMLILGVIVGGMVVNSFQMSNSDFVLASFGLIFCILGFLLLKVADNIFKQKLKKIYYIKEIIK